MPVCVPVVWVTHVYVSEPGENVQAGVLYVVGADPRQQVPLVKHHRRHQPLVETQCVNHAASLLPEFTTIHVLNMC